MNSNKKTTPNLGVPRTPSPIKIESGSLELIHWQFEPEIHRFAQLIAEI